MSTGRYYFTIYSLFAIFQPAGRPILLWTGFRNFFPFPYCSPLRNLKLSLSSNTNVKWNLVLASPRSLLARRRVTFGTSTGDFWHVDGSFWHVDGSHLACRWSFWHALGTDPQSQCLLVLQSLFPGTFGIQVLSVFKSLWVFMDSSENLQDICVLYPWICGSLPPNWDVLVRSRSLKTDKHLSLWSVFLRCHKIEAKWTIWKRWTRVQSYHIMFKVSLCSCCDFSTAFWASSAFCCNSLTCFSRPQASSPNLTTSPVEPVDVLSTRPSPKASKEVMKSVHLWML